MDVGNVKWFDTAKGYGVISPQEGGRDVSVHLADLHQTGLRSLTAGQRVTYDLRIDDLGGADAVNVKLVNTENKLVGVVKWFNPNKGFGFILPQHGGEDVYVHVLELRATGLWGLIDGQSVSYQLLVRDGRPTAANVMLV